MRKLTQQALWPITALDKLILDLFKRPSVIIFIRGRRGSGKTDISLLIAETLYKHKVISEIATNIKILESPFTINHISSLDDLEAWLKSSRSRKLYILDEAGKAIRRRAPMSSLNIHILDNIQVIRHYRASLIIIAPSDEFVDRAALGEDILDVVITKPSFKNPKVALWADLIDMQQFTLKNIPATSVRYDSYDVAPFTKTSPIKTPRFKDEDMKLLWAWSHDQLTNLTGAQRTQLCRLRKNFIKNTLESMLSLLTSESG